MKTIQKLEYHSKFCFNIQLLQKNNEVNLWGVENNKILLLDFKIILKPQLEKIVLKLKKNLKTNVK